MNVTIYDPDNETGNEPIDHLTNAMEPDSVSVGRPGRRKKLTATEFIDLIKEERFTEAAAAIKDGRVSIWTCDTARRLFKHNLTNIPVDFWLTILSESEFVDDTI